MLLFIAAVLAGLALLTAAADHFVVGAARLSMVFRISPVVVGAIVVGFGTSLPELLVSGIAAGQGSLDIAVGNVVGSNVANLTLVLGAAALFLPPAVTSQTLKREAPISALAVLAFALLVQRGLGRPEGIVLIAGLAVALAVILRSAYSGDDRLAVEVEEFVAVGRAPAPGGEMVRTAAGLAGTLVGAQLLVYGARGLAVEAGLAEGFVGLTLVAVGTSLPELVTAVQAARRGESDLLIGNLLGSNIFNSLAVGGLAGAVGPGALEDPEIAGVATMVMVAIAALGWLFMGTGRRVERWEGGVLLVVYAGMVLVLTPS